MFGCPADNDQFTIVADTNNGRFSFTAAHASHFMQFSVGGSRNLKLSGASGSEINEFTGKVGIGTATVQSKLHIESGGTGNAYGSCLYLHGDTATNFPAARIDNATGGNASETHGLLINNTAAGAGLRVNSNTVSYTHLRAHET